MRGLILFVAAIGSFRSPAIGQEHLTGKPASQVVDALATCTVIQEKSKVIEALSTSIDYKRDARVMRSLRGKTCVPNRVVISVDPIMYRGMLARAVVRTRYGNGPANLDAIPIRETDTWSSIMGFADCVVRADPVESYKLVLAEAVSRAEQEAFDALSGKIDSCKPWKTMAWSKVNLISFFSEAYYRASRADAASSR